MRWTYACPHCQAMLNPDEAVVLIGECGPHRILIGFHPEPGNYRAYLPPEFKLQEGSMWEFSCPVCSRSLSAEIAPELCALDMATQGVRHRLYGESLLRIQQEMKDKGADKIFWQDYIPLPKWRAPTMDSSPSDYDLYMISYKKVEFKQSRGFSPLSRELAPKQFCDINPETAKAKGINDGDLIGIESQNAVTGAVRTVNAEARYVNGIRPDTVAMAHHYGGWTHPWQSGRPRPLSLPEARWAAHRHRWPVHPPWP